MLHKLLCVEHVLVLRGLSIKLVIKPYLEAYSVINHRHFVTLLRLGLLLSDRVDVPDDYLLVRVIQVFQEVVCLFIFGT